jgi:hypothetical protein
MGLLYLLMQELRNTRNSFSHTEEKLRRLRNYRMKIKCDGLTNLRNRLYVLSGYIAKLRHTKYSLLVFCYFFFTWKTALNKILRRTSSVLCITVRALGEIERGYGKL